MKFIKKALSLLLSFLMCITGPALSNALADGYGGNVASGSTTSCGGDGSSPCIKCKDCEDLIRGSSPKRVYFHNGSEYLRETDLYLPGVIPIEIQRTYNNQSTFDSPLGYGWDISFNERLRTYADNSVTIRTMTGKKLIFILTGGTYVCEESPHLTLLQNQDGSFVFFSNPAGIRSYYDRDGRLVRRQDHSGNSLQMIYSNDLKPLIGISPNSITPDTPMIVSYNHQLQRIEQWDSNNTFTGRFVDLSYDTTSGRLISITDSTGQVISYQHDVSGNLIRVDYPEDLFKSYQYTDINDPHNMTNNLRGFGTNSAEIQVTRQYDEDDRIIREEYAGGILTIDYTIPLQKTKVTKTIVDSGDTTLHQFDTVYEFSSQGFLIQETDDQKSIELIRDSRNNIVERILWQNNGSATSPNLTQKVSTQFTFDENNLPTKASVEIENGEKIITEAFYENGALVEKQVYSTATPDKFHQTFYEYNYINDIHTTVSSVKSLVSNSPTLEYSSVSFDYNDANQPTSIIFDNGDTITMEYENGLLTNDNGIIFDYNNRGNIISSTDRNGNTTGYEYDNLGRITRITNALGDSTLLTYIGWQLTSTEFGKNNSSPGQISNFTYDQYDRLLESSIALDGSPVMRTTYSYDSENNVRTITDQMDNTVNYSYDPWNRLALVTDALENSISYAYSFDGQIAEITDPLGNKTHYTYDMRRKLIQITDSLEGVTSFTRNQMGQIAQIKDPEERVFTFEYDLVGRTILQDNPVTGNTSFSYDKRGRIHKIQNQDGSAKEYQYNNLNLVEQVSLHDSSHNSSIFRYGYDDMGNLLWFSDSTDSDPLYSLSYDALNRLKTKTLNQINKTTQLEYTPHGQRQNIAVLNNNTELFSFSYSYNTAGQLTSITESPTNKTTSFLYDSRGFLVEKTYANNVSATLDYSSVGQLTDLHYQQSDNSTIDHFQYSLDDLNKIATISSNQGATTYGYDPLSRLTSVDYPDTNGLPDENYSYDLTGNRLTSNLTNDWTYNSSGQLVGYNGNTINYNEKGQQVSETTGGATTTYSYDLLNRLQAVNKTGLEATYSYNFSNQRFKKTVNGSDTWYLYDGSNILAEFNQSGQLTRYYNTLPGNFDLLTVTDNGNSYTALTNHQETPLYILDENQNTVWQANYQSFGQALVNNDVDNDGNDFHLPQRLPGQFHDSETGLYYNWHRYLNPESGRYISPDPIGLNGGINLYAYTDDNPLNLIDPSGLTTTKRLWNGTKGFIKVVGGGIALFVVATTTAPIAAGAMGLAALTGVGAITIGGVEMLNAAVSSDATIDKTSAAISEAEVFVDPRTLSIWFAAQAAGADCPKSFAYAQISGTIISLHSIATEGLVGILDKGVKNANGLSTGLSSFLILADGESTLNNITIINPGQKYSIPLTSEVNGQRTLRIQTVVLTPEFNYQDFLKHETLGRDSVLFNFPTKNGFIINQNNFQPLKK